jgi:hypothetical protein
MRERTAMLAAPTSLNHRSVLSIVAIQAAILTQKVKSLAANGSTFIAHLPLTPLFPGSRG